MRRISAAKYPRAVTSLKSLPTDRSKAADPDTYVLLHFFEEVWGRGGSKSKIFKIKFLKLNKILKLNKN